MTKIKILKHPVTLMIYSMQFVLHVLYLIVPGTSVSQGSGPSLGKTNLPFELWTLSFRKMETWNNTRCQVTESLSFWDEMKGWAVEGRRIPTVVRCDFSSCLESSEIRHVNSFCVKNVPVLLLLFFSSRQKNMDKITRKSTPPLSVSKQCTGFPSLRTG